MQRANAQRIKELQNKMAKDEEDKKAAAEKELTEIYDKIKKSKDELLEQEQSSL